MQVKEKLFLSSLRLVGKYEKAFPLFFANFYQK